MPDNHFTHQELSRSRKRLLSEHLGKKVSLLIEHFSKHPLSLEGSGYSFDENLSPLLQQEVWEPEQDNEPDIDFAHEHWLVSDWLGDHLSQKGEMVAQLFGLTIWGRKTSGQAVYLDSVIAEIFDEQQVNLERGSHAR